MNPVLRKVIQAGTKANAWLYRRTNGRIGGRGMGGSKAIPQWFLNLQAAGKGHTQIRERQQDVEARLISGTEREKLWPQIAARAPHFAKWQARTGRVLPVVVLTAQSPVDGTGVIGPPP